ncbi:MAG: sigma-70 family RNA polymerase sigma factor [Acidimicrobiia bacterium]
MSPDSRCQALRTTTIDDLAWLYRTARRLTHDTEDARDLTQETLTRACQHMDPDRSDPEKRAWLKRVLVNLSRDRYRRRGRLIIDPNEGLTLGAGEPDPGAATEETALDALTDQHVRLAIARLPPAWGDAVTLVDIRGLSYEEASLRIGIRPGTVSSRVSRGRLHLRKELWEVAAAAGIVTDLVCDAAAELLKAYSDGKVTLAESSFVAEHLAGCGRCLEAEATLTR